MLKHCNGFLRSLRFCAQRPGELRVLVTAKAEDDFGEVLLGGRAAGAANHLACVDGTERFQREVSLADENSAGFKFVDQRQQSDRSGFQLESSHVQCQREIIAVVGFAEANIAELAVEIV